jgi:hypothetical protein
MNQYTQGRWNRQVHRVRQCRRQMVEDQDLCLTRLLPQEQVETAPERHQGKLGTHPINKEGAPCICDGGIVSSRGRRTVTRAGCRNTEGGTPSTRGRIG